MTDKRRAAAIANHRRDGFRTEHDYSTQDFMARQAELLVLDRLPLDDADRARQRAMIESRRVDAGFDVTFRGWSFDVKWSPVRPRRGDRVYWAGLKVKTWKPLAAHGYVCVLGENVEDLKIYGWASRTDVRNAQVLDFGYTTWRGDPATVYAIDAASLRPWEALLAIPENVR